MNQTTGYNDTNFSAFWLSFERCQTVGFVWEGGDLNKLKGGDYDIQRKLYEGWNFNSGNYLFRTDTK